MSYEWFKMARLRIVNPGRVFNDKNIVLETNHAFNVLRNPTFWSFRLPDGVDFPCPKTLESNPGLPPVMGLPSLGTSTAPLGACRQ